MYKYKKIDETWIYRTLNRSQYQFHVIENNTPILILSFQFGNTGSCSSENISNISFCQDATFKKHKDKISYILNEWSNSYSMIYTIQNVTKNTYKVLLNFGFKDYYRFPGKYTSSYGTGNTKEDCLSLMYLTKKDDKKALEKTKKLLKITEKEPKAISKLSLSKGYLCVNPTKTLTLNKVYQGIKGINSYRIKGDDNSFRYYDKKRFIKVTF